MTDRVNDGTASTTASPEEVAQEVAALEARLPGLRARAKRQHRAANLTFLVAGLGLGSAVYLARTRFSAFVTGARFVTWATIVGAGAIVFAAAARLHDRATRVDEELREVLARLLELRLPPRRGRGTMEGGDDGEDAWPPRR